MSCFNVLFGQRQVNEVNDDRIDIDINSALAIRYIALDRFSYFTHSSHSLIKKFHNYFTQEINQADQGLVTIDLRNYRSLRNLNLSDNALIEIDLSRNQDLEELQINHNQLTEIDLSHNQNIRFIELEGNQLTEIDLSHNQNLQEVDLFHNQLTDIQLPEHSNIRQLNLEHNQFTHLPDSILSLPAESHVLVRHNPFPPGYIEEFRQRIEQHRENHPEEGPAIVFNPPMQNLAAPVQHVHHLFVIDMEELAANPQAILNNYLSFWKEIDQRPLIQFRQEGNPLPGEDGGGLTRDFITRLFNAFRPVSGPGPLPLIDALEYGTYFPAIDLSLPRAEADRLSYQAIGKIYAFILNQEQAGEGPLIKTGQLFHPAVFEMIHSLTDEEASWIPDEPNFEEAPIPSAIYNKLFKIYVKKICSNHITDEECNLFVEDPNHPLPPSWNGIIFETFQDLKEEFDAIALPVLIIAKSMRNAGVNWANMANISAQDLQNNIQGTTVSAETMIQEIEAHPAPIDTPHRMSQDYFIRWIKENAASEERLSQLCYAVSGSPYLHPLEITAQVPNDGPIFHTCLRTIDLPNYPDYESFKEAFDIAIDAAQDGRFDLA